MKSKILVFIGKSASGKDTLINEFREDDNFHLMISHTTRPIRENELSGREYHFLTKEEFLNEEDNFLEVRSYNTLVNNVPDVWYYGLHKKEVQEDKINLVILDLQGYLELKEVLKDKCDVLGYFLDVDDDIRTERAKKRGSFDEYEWNRRLEDDHKVFVNVEDQVDFFIKEADTFTPIQLKQLILQSLTLNHNLLKSQKVSSINATRIIYAYNVIDYYFTSTEFYDPKVLAKSIEEMENRLQEYWNFEVDSTKHNYWYKIPGCTCPKLDNAERFGSKYKIIDPNCPFHGEW